MNHHPILPASIFFIALAGISGCTTTMTEVQPASMGTMIGTVQLYEMDQTSSSTSAGVDVTIIGTSRHATSDSTGHYVFNGLPTGYYQMRFSKPHFSSFVSNSPEPFIGADTDWFGPTAQLYRINNWGVTIDSLDVESIPNGQDTELSLAVPRYSTAIIVVDSSGEPVAIPRGIFPVPTPYVAFFLGRTPKINYEDITSYFDWTYTNQYSSTFEILRFATSLANTDTVYLVAYPISGDVPLFTYYSGDTVKTEFTGFGPPSNVVKIVLP